MHRWLAPNVIVPVYERLTGRRAWSEMRLLQSLQWRSAAELEARAFAKLGLLLTQAADHVPYYRDLYARYDVHPSDIRCLDDLAKVPVTTKEALRANFPARTVADNLPQSRFVDGATSGSTGSPFRFYTDADSERARHASYLFFLDWTGAALWETRVVIAHQGYLPPDSTVVRLARRVLLGEEAVAPVQRRDGPPPRSVPMSAGSAAARATSSRRTRRTPCGSPPAFWSRESTSVRIQPRS